MAEEAKVVTAREAFPTRPFLAVYVVWHPSFQDGAELADQIYKHFRRAIFDNVSGGTGLSVAYRSEAGTPNGVPAPIDFDSAETNAVVALVDETLAQDEEWRSYLDGISVECDQKGFGHRVFPVTFSPKAMERGAPTQAIRWHEWTDLDASSRFLRLRSDLAHQFSKMLRQYLGHLERPGNTSGQLESFLKPVQVFLSHSKHDPAGKRLANSMRDFVYGHTELAAFFDLRNIPPGLHFEEVLEHYVRVSAVVAFHTDSYSTREWCRREILEAKRASVPLVVANAISNFEERGFPYMGNVPVVRLDARSAKKRVPMVVATLIDEVLKDFLWKCRVALVKASAPPGVSFLPRPPELLSLVSLEAAGTTKAIGRLVYPDPPLGLEEATLFATVSPGTVLQSHTEWVAEFGA